MRFSAAFTLSLPVLAVASAVPRGGHEPPVQCNTGPIQCCNSVQDASTLSQNILFGLLTALIGPVTDLVGVTCNPLTAIGAGGNSCTSQPVCCTGNQFNGLINVGCTPININT